MRIIKESVVITHYYDENGKESLVIDVIEQYHYDSEEEKYNHKKQMEAKGFIDSGQVRENIGDMSNPVYVWYGGYHNHSDRIGVNTMLAKAANAADIEFDTGIRLSNKIIESRQIK